MTALAFSHFSLSSQTSEDAIMKSASDFLQGQITADVSQISDAYIPTAICNLKGRVDFGLWVCKTAESYEIVVSSDCADAFAGHVKKYGAFSKINLSEHKTISAVVVNGVPTFSDTADGTTIDDWMAASIAQGNAVISAASRGLFQPQELRLHQRDGVHYDKGCYLGQEVVARIWFKASPKAWLHRVSHVSDVADIPENGAEVSKHVHVVNAIATQSGYDALVVARPEALAESNFTVLALPDTLSGSVARPK